MKTPTLIRICFFVASTAFIPALQAQSTTTTPTNPSGSETDSKSPETSPAQERSSSTGTGTTAATTPDKYNSKDTTTSLDKNPSTASTDSADKSATKDPTTADREEHSGMADKGEKGEYSDKHFLMKAAQGGMTEVELGKVAQQKGSSADVKQFGSHMEMDHSKANVELKGVADKDGVTIPDKLDAHHQAMVDKFNAMSGPAFDKAYVNAMVEDHKKTIADFEKASTTATNPDVKNFATNTLPTLKGHLADIESIQAKMK